MSSQFQVLSGHEDYKSVVADGPASMTELGFPVGLVVMPWGSIRKPALAVPILKRCVEKAGFLPEVHFLNVALAEMIGLEAYELLADEPFYPEWFFSQALFGESGTQEMSIGWNDLKGNPAAKFFREGILKGVKNSETFCRELAEEVVPRFIEECVTSIDWSVYRVVGFTTTFAQSLSAALLAKRVKELCPDIKIVFGGANVDSEMGVEFMKAFPWVDYVVHGEAEITFPRLLRNIAEDNYDEPMPGVSCRVNGMLSRGDADTPPFVDMNLSPSPDYSDYLSAVERAGLKSQIAYALFFESSRGCWWGAKHHCTFCGLNANGMAYRKKDADRVLGEILDIAHTFRCLRLYATDNILPMEFFSQLLPKLAQADLDIHIFYEVKANLTREQMRTLATSGVREIQPGIESLSTRLLKNMNKGVKAIQNIQLLKYCSEMDVFATYNLLFGFPGERDADYADYPRLCRLLGHLQPPGFLGPVIFERFSPYHTNQHDYGLNLEATLDYKFLYPEKRVDLDRIAYYFHPKPDSVNNHFLDQENPPAYLAKLSKAYSLWKENYTRVHCYYNKGPGYLVINDNRPLAADQEYPESGSTKRKQIHLDEPVASIYLYCDENRSRQAIDEMMHKKFGSEYTEARVDRWLDNLVKKGLMFTEDGRYLSLAVRSRWLEPPNKVVRDA